MSPEEFDATVACRYFASAHCPVLSPAKGCKSLFEAADKVWGDIWLEEERDQFSLNLSAALASGRIHYVVVAQRFTPAMERTAAYLNSVAGDARFYLVELIRFSNGEMDAFEARTVLKPPPHRTAGGTSPTKLTASTFLSSEPDPSRRERLETFLELCTGLGLSVFWGTSGISIRMPTADGTRGILDRLPAATDLARLAAGDHLRGPSNDSDGPVDQRSDVRRWGLAESRLVALQYYAQRRNPVVSRAIVIIRWHRSPLSEGDEEVQPAEPQSVFSPTALTNRVRVRRRARSRSAVSSSRAMKSAW